MGPPGDRVSFLRQAMMMLAMISHCCLLMKNYFTIKDNSEIAEVTSQSIQLESKTKDTAIKKWWWTDSLGAVVTKALLGPSWPPSVGFVQTWWAARDVHQKALPELGTGSHWHHHCFKKNEGVGRFYAFLLFHFQTLICDSSFVVRPPRSPSLRVRKLLRKSFPSLRSALFTYLLPSSLPLTLKTGCTADRT